jgi:hypothetical protein
LQSREACIRLRLQSSEHPLITDFDFAKNFIDLREHSHFDFAKSLIDLREYSLDKVNHLGDRTPQLLYVALALFTATVEIGHVPPSYPTSSWNCSNNSRKFSGGPLVPSLITGVTV